jgi:hypothetical protein
MIIISGLLTAFGRMMGPAATMTIAWSTILLFGRIQESKRELLSFITLGSLAWAAALVGVVVPAVGTFFITAVPRPDLIQASWIRFAMVLLAVFLPYLIGLATVNFVEPKARPVGWRRFAEALRGYPYSAAYAFIVAFLAGWALARKIRSLRRGWVSAHIPMIVKPGRYETVAADFETALTDAGLAITRKRAGRGLALPLRVLASVGGERVRRLVPRELVEFEGDGLGVLVYPSDVALLGRAELVAAARAAIARRLAFEDAYLTSTMESQQIEDRLREIARKPHVGAKDFQPLDDALTSRVGTYDEWETLYRLRLQVEQERRLVDRSAPAEAA